MVDTKIHQTFDANRTRFALEIQARNRETEKNYWIQMVLEDRAESAPGPLFLLEPEGNA
jgi:hypothetical protein